MLPKFALVVVKTYFIVLANVRRPWRTPSSEHAQVLVEQHDRGRLLGHVDGAVDRDADVRGVQRGRVVDAVAHVADDAAGWRERADDALLLDRLDLGEDVDVPSPAPRASRRPTAFDVGAGHHAVASRPTSSADVRRDQAVVAGDHAHRDAGRREVARASALHRALAGRGTSASRAKVRPARRPACEPRRPCGSREATPSTRKPVRAQRPRTAPGLVAARGDRRRSARRRRSTLAQTARTSVERALGDQHSVVPPSSTSTLRRLAREVVGQLVELARAGWRPRPCAGDDRVVDRVGEAGLELAFRQASRRTRSLGWPSRSSAAVEHDRARRSSCPVLSVHRTVIAPKSSIASRRLTMTRSRAMSRAPCGQADRHDRRQQLRGEADRQREREQRRVDQRPARARR